MECSSDEVSIDLFSLFKQGNITESMSFSQNEIHIQNREGHFCCELLWCFVNSMVAIDMEVISPVIPHCHYDIRKLEVSFDAYYSAIIVAMTLPLPSISESRRYHYFHCLLQRAKICTDVANNFFKNKKERPFKTNDSGKPQPFRVNNDDVDV